MRVRIPSPLEFVGEYGWSIVSMLGMALLICWFDILRHAPLPVDAGLPTTTFSMGF